MADKKGQEGKKGKPSNAGKRKGKFQVFFNGLSARKLRRVLKNSGPEAAKAYAQKNGLLTEFGKLQELAGQREEARRRRDAAREARRIAAKLAAEKKARFSARSKKAAATRRARKEAATTPPPTTVEAPQPQS